MKIRISALTWLLWLAAVVNGSWKPMLFLFLLMSLHELAHCSMAWFFHLPISGISVYPFGLAAHMETLMFQPCLVQLCVLMAGPAVHLAAPFLIGWMQHQHLISAVFADWCRMINGQLLFFNCLAIWPLDGAQMVRALLFCFAPFKLSMKLISGISLFFCGMLFFVFLPHSPASLIVCLTLAFLSAQEFLRTEKRMHDFCLFRLLDEKKRKKRCHRWNDLYVYYDNVIIREGKNLSEKEWLWRYLS